MCIQCLETAQWCYNAPQIAWPASGTVSAHIFSIVTFNTHQFLSRTSLIASSPFFLSFFFYPSNYSSAYCWKLNEAHSSLKAQDSRLCSLLHRIVKAFQSLQRCLEQWPSVSAVLSKYTPSFANVLPGPFPFPNPLFFLLLLQETSNILVFSLQSMMLRLQFWSLK